MRTTAAPARRRSLLRPLPACGLVDRIAAGCCRRLGSACSAATRTSSAADAACDPARRSARLCQRRGHPGDRRLPAAGATAVTALAGSASHPVSAPSRRIDEPLVAIQSSPAAPTALWHGATRCSPTPAGGRHAGVGAAAASRRRCRWCSRRRRSDDRRRHGQRWRGGVPSRCAATVRCCRAAAAATARRCRSQPRGRTHAAARSTRANSAAAAALACTAAADRHAERRLGGRHRRLDAASTRRRAAARRRCWPSPTAASAPAPEARAAAAARLAPSRRWSRALVIEKAIDAAASKQPAPLRRRQAAASASAARIAALERMVEQPAGRSQASDATQARAAARAASPHRRRAPLAVAADRCGAAAGSARRLAGLAAARAERARRRAWRAASVRLHRVTAPVRTRACRRRSPASRRPAVCPHRRSRFVTSEVGSLRHRPAQQSRARPATAWPPGRPCRRRLGALRQPWRLRRAGAPRARRGMPPHVRGSAARTCVRARRPAPRCRQPPSRTSRPELRLGHGRAGAAAVRDPDDAGARRRGARRVDRGADRPGAAGRVLRRAGPGRSGDRPAGASTCATPAAAARCRT